MRLVDYTGSFSFENDCSLSHLSWLHVAFQVLSVPCQISYHLHASPLFHNPFRAGITLRRSTEINSASFSTFFLRQLLSLLLFLFGSSISNRSGCLKRDPEAIRRYRRANAPLRFFRLVYTLRATSLGIFDINW